MNLSKLWDLPVAQLVKNLPVMQETWVRSLGWEDPQEKGTTTYSSILAGVLHKQRSLVGYSLWVPKESDTTEQLTLNSTHSRR